MRTHNEMPPAENHVAGAASTINCAQAQPSPWQMAERLRVLADGKKPSTEEHRLLVDAAEMIARQHGEMREAQERAEMAVDNQHRLAAGIKLARLALNSVSFE